MNSISALKICFSLVFVLMSGCSIFRGASGNVWPVPSKPSSEKVDIVSVSNAIISPDGYYLSRQSASNLTHNVEELKAYTEKLDALIDRIIKYYGDSKKEYKKIE